MNYTLHSPSGEIIGLVQGTLHESDIPEGCAAFADHYDAGVYYFLGGYPELRPQLQLQVNNTELTPLETFRVDGIPEGTLVKYPGGEAVVDDGYIEWSAVEPGTYMFTFTNFPYTQETINATVSAV